jgi:hypothetical protein
MLFSFADEMKMKKTAILLVNFNFLLLYWSTGVGNDLVFFIGIGKLLLMKPAQIFLILLLIAKLIMGDKLTFNLLL